MAVAVTTINNLKAVDTTTGKKLRWVEEKRAWYFYEPISSSTADNEDIILPNSNSGRWIKQLAQVPSNNLIWTAYTGTQTINPSVNSGLVVRSTNGIVTINLPPSPLVGQQIAVNHLSSGVLNVTRVNRNGNAIQGNTTDVGLELFLPNTNITFIYSDATNGWTYNSNTPVRVQATYSQTFTFASNGDTNGYFYWLGTNSGTSGTWVNPVNSNGAVGAKVYATLGNGATGVNLLNRSTSISSIASSNQFAGLTFYLVTDVDNPLRTFRLSQLLLRSGTTTNQAIRSFQVSGLNSVDYPANIQNITSADGATLMQLREANWDIVYRVINDTTMATTASAWALYNVNATQFYSTYKISMIGLDSGGSISPLVLSSVEFYGEVRI